MLKHHAYIGFGSNLGNRVENCRRALEALAALANTNLLKSSSIYETDPVGFAEQPRFVNGVAWLETAGDAHWLLGEMLGIEVGIGRVRTFKWGRVIDLDLLFFDDLVIDSAELRVPHPLLHERRFVLQPLSEIAPHFCHPILGKTVAELLHDLKDGDQACEVLLR